MPLLIENAVRQNAATCRHMTKPAQGLRQDTTKLSVGSITKSGLHSSQIVQCGCETDLREIGTVPSAAMAGMDLRLDEAQPDSTDRDAGGRWTAGAASAWRPAGCPLSPRL